MAWRQRVLSDIRMVNQLKALVIIISGLCAGGCFPVPYSYEITGSVVDDGGHPVQGAAVVTMVYKSCGSLGGKASQRLKQSIVKTGADGRYRDKIQGVSLLHFELISACLGYEHHTVACKAGFRPSLPATAAGDGILRLEPGSGWSHLEMPPECSNPRVIAEAQAMPQAPQSMPPPVKASVHIPLWDGKGFFQMGYADPSERDSPSVGIAPDVPSQAHWLVVKEWITGGRPYREAALEHGYGYWTVSDFRGSETTNTYVFLLKASKPGTPLFDEGSRSRLTKDMAHLEPVGGTRWTVTGSGGHRTGVRMEPVPVTREDWNSLQDDIVKVLAPAMAEGVALHAPREMTLQAKRKPAPPNKKFTVRPTGQKLTMPLWLQREWMYPIVLDRAGPSAPYPGMPVVKIEASKNRLVAIERTRPDGVREVEITFGNDEFFFTKNYAAADGLYRTSIFELTRPDPTANPLIKGAADRDSGLEPRGGITWNLVVEGGARKAGELELESLTREDWKRLRPDIVAFSEREKNRGIHFFDPAPLPVRYTLTTWVPGLEIFPDVYDAGSPGMPLVRIPYYHQIGSGWITVEEFRMGDVTTVSTAFSQEPEFIYEGKPHSMDGTLTVYVFPTWLARYGSTPLVEFPDKPVQSNGGGMVFERAASFEPLAALTWKIDTRNGERAGGPIKIAAAGPEVWHEFRSQIAKLNQDLNAVKYQQYIKVIFDPTSSGLNANGREPR